MFLQSIFSFVFVLLTTIIIKTKANQDQLAHEKPTDFKCLWYKHPVIRILKIVSERDGNNEERGLYYTERLTQQDQPSEMCRLCRSFAVHNSF